MDQPKKIKSLTTNRFHGFDPQRVKVDHSAQKRSQLLAVTYVYGLDPGVGFIESTCLMQVRWDATPEGYVHSFYEAQEELAKACFLLLVEQTKKQVRSKEYRTFEGHLPCRFYMFSVVKAFEEKNLEV